MPMLRLSALLALLLASGASAQTDSTAAPEATVFFGDAVAARKTPLLPGPSIALTLDPSFTAETGSDALVAAHRGLTDLEDRVLPARLWREDGAARKVGGMAYRFARLALLDEPLAHVTFLTQHEVFGHGARTREFGFEQTGYVVTPPFPYWDGHGSAGFSAPRGMTPDQRQLLSHNGSHSTDILAADVREAAFRRGRMRQGEALLYLHGALDLANYFVSTGDHPPSNSDVIAWLNRLNTRAGRDGREPLALKTAQKQAFLAAADPVLWASVATVGWSYLAKGDASGPLPVFAVRGARVMPSVRFGWSPHGTQGELAVLAGARGRFVRVSARHTLGGPYAAWQAGAEVAPVLQRGPLALGLTADVWRAPALDLDLDVPDREDNGGWGGALLARADVGLWRGRGGVRAEIGAKTTGVLRGEEIGAGPIVRLGLFLRE